MGYAVGLGIVAWYAGRFVERAVGRRGMLVRLAINAAVLYSAFALLPGDVSSSFQTQLLSTLAVAAFYNSQTWTTTKLV